LDLGTWNLPGPEFTFGNRVELELKGFIEVFELGWELIPCSTRFLNQNQTHGWFQVVILTKTRLGFFITI